MTDEETRAAAWRAQQVRRATFVASNEKRLRGSQSVRRDLEQKWSAVINRTQEEPR